MADEVLQLNKAVNIFDDATFQQVKEDRQVFGAERSTAARADIIAHEMRRRITENMDDDPALYQKFSVLIQQAIDDFKARRISDINYLQKVSEIREKVVGNIHDNIPEMLEENSNAMAYFGSISEILIDYMLTNEAKEMISSLIALKIDKVLIHHAKVKFWDDQDAQNRAINDIEDYLLDELKQEKGFEIKFDDIDKIVTKSFNIAKHRSRS
jgi:type I restriction enzyme R subunit